MPTRWPEIFILIDSFGQLALRIHDKRQIHFVVGGEFFRESAQGWRRDLGLMLEDVVAEVVAQLLGMGIEVAGDDGRVVRPVVHGQREVVADDRNFVGSGGFLDQGRGTPAVGALEVFKNHQGNLGAFGRP